MKKDNNMCWNGSIEYVGFQFHVKNIFYEFRYDYNYLGPHINFKIGDQAYGYYWPDKNSRYTELPVQCKRLAFYNDKTDENWKEKNIKLGSILNLDPTICN
jgi:hypothetical protein